jgi:hypothetical protein
MICKSCGTVHARALPGSGWIELTLWVLFLWPIALVYTLWRRMNRTPACGACGSRDVVGLETPAGRALARRYHPGGVPLPPPPPPGPRLWVVVGIPLALIAPFLLAWAWAALTS